MKRTLTPEQKAAAADRRARFRALVKRLADMPETARLQITQGGFATVEGRSLSLCNCMLIALQLPHATVLGGFRQWIKAGRCVSKGQHGAMIWCPIGAGRDDQAEPKTEEIEAGESVRFIIGTVFDISQTQELGADPEETPAETQGNRAEIMQLTGGA